MDWTRSPLMRSLALAASVGLVLIHWTERDTWFWVGVGLVVLNVPGFLTNRSRAGRDVRSAASHLPSGQLDDTEREDGESHCLADLLSLPGVAAALAAGPRLWRQVSYLDDQIEPTTAEELAAFVWLEHDGGWAIGLGDEVKPYVDLDINEADDPVISVLESHPAVGEAFHEDREVYRIEQRRPISTEEFAELTARALVSHHMRAAARS